MKTPLLIAIFLFSLFAKAEVFVVSEDAGFDSANSTNFLQFALYEATDTLLIDNVGEPWITGPLIVNNSNLTIVLESGTVMNALEGAYGEFDPMFRIRDVENITVLGYGAFIQMNKQEYIDLADSEFRHAFNLGSVVNFRMEGLEIKDSGGDGLLIGKSFQPGSTQNYCENLVIRNCIFDNNYRQGISIVSVKDCLIENCIMKNTIGTLPEAGIDIEPDDPAERIEELVIQNCQFINNNGNGIMLALFYLDDSSLDVSVTVEDCYFEDNFTLSNIYAYAEIACLDNKGNGVDGFVNFERCYV
ncbi:MAG: right-handed parallel beta-helix repeat-containing protein, partial [Cryomorphaceae bacterium]